eukprot:m.171816 g.171816  ORF g.171816 m.171816 type:complete len:126 (-) comp14564_c0_seq3:1958-2335(-)
MSVSSELQNYIQSAFPNLPGVICISITDRDGAVVLEVQRGSATSPLATRHMYAAAGLVTDNGNVGLGDVLMLTAEAENGTVSQWHRNKYKDYSSSIISTLGVVYSLDSLYASTQLHVDGCSYMHR